MAPETAGAGTVGTVPGTATAVQPVATPMETAVMPQTMQVRRSGLGMVGLLTVLVGAWAGIVPFVGPVFGYDVSGSTSWYWNLAHALLWMVPGAVAVLLGLALMAAAPAAGMTMSGAPSSIGFMIILCGAWLVIGPSAWAVLEPANHVFNAASPLHELAYRVGSSLGPGVILSALGGIATASRITHRRVAPAVMPSSATPSTRRVVAA